ncbi:MAG: DUF1800 family protein, partial [Caulobacteraceae bacterium]
MTIDKDLGSAIAVTRFGLGAKPGEIAIARGDPQGYLSAQIRSAGADQPINVSSTVTARLAAFHAYKQRSHAEKMAHQAKSASSKSAIRLLRREGDTDLLGRMQLAADTSASFRERWAMFWANHFTVSGKRAAVAPLVGPFEQ